MVHHASLVLACLLGSAAASFVPSDTNLDERSSAQVSTDGTLYCGNFGSADKDTVSGLERDLSTGNLKDKWYHIKAGECNRVHCDDTSGIYVCNVCVSHGPFFPPIFNHFPLPPILQSHTQTWSRNAGKRPQARLTAYHCRCRTATLRYRSVAQ